MLEAPARTLSPARTDLVGRTAELSVALGAVVRSGGAVVIGAAGVGKTTLANAVAKRARANGDEVLWTVATEASRRIPFGALGILLPDDFSSFDPAMAIGHIRRKLRTGRRAPLVVVDDAHLLDDQSAAVLLGLATMGVAPALVTVRGGERPPDAVTALWKDGFLATVELGPLDRAATSEFLASCVGGKVAEGTVELLWRWTGGIPLYLSELVRFGLADRRLTDIGGLWLWRGDLGLSPRLAELLDHRVNGLSSDAVDALCALALAQPISLEALAAVTSTDAVTEVDDLGLLAVAERAGPILVQIAQPLLAAGVVRLLTPMRRRRLADALVAVSGHRGPVPGETAWMLDASRPPRSEQLVAGARDVLLQNPRWRFASPSTPSPTTRARRPPWSWPRPTPSSVVPPRHGTPSGRRRRELRPTRSDWRSSSRRCRLPRGRIGDHGPPWPSCGRRGPSWPTGWGPSSTRRPRSSPCSRPGQPMPSLWPSGPEPL